MKPLALLLLVASGCAQLQAQRGPSWLRAQSGWTADRIVCLGHSGADGGVRDADWAAARCTAGYAQAWLKPAIESQVKEEARRKRAFVALARLAKVTDRYENPATGEVSSRMVLTQEEVDRQLQREFMDEQDVLAGLRAKVGTGLAAGTQAAAVDPLWLKTSWAKIEPPAALPEKVRAELAAQEAAKKAKEEAKSKAGEPGQPAGDKAKPSGAEAAPKAPPAKPAAKPAAKSAKKSTKPGAPAAAKKAVKAGKKPPAKAKSPAKKVAPTKPAKKKAKPSKESKKPSPKAAPKAPKKDPS